LHPVEDVLRWLADPTCVPTREDATRIRDRAAGFLGSNPALSAKLALALERAAFRQPSESNRFVEAISLRCRAEASVFLGRIHEANDLYRRAHEHAAGAHALRGQILVGWIGVLGAMGEIGRAKRLAKHAQDLLERARDRVYLGKLHMNLGNLAYHAQRFEEADARYRLASIAFRAAKVRDGTWAGLLINQAVACTNLGRFEEARVLFREADARCHELGLDLHRGQALFDLAFLERARGDFRESLDRLNEAEAIAERLGARELRACVNRERAMTYLELNMPAEAVEFAHAAAEAFEAEGQDVDANLARVSEAWALALLGRVDGGLALLDESIARFRSRRLAGFVANARVHRVMLLLEGEREGRSIEARASITRELAAARRATATVGAERVSVLVEGTAVDVHLARGEGSKAEAAAERARRLVHALPLGDRAEVWSLSGRAAHARGDLVRARHWHRRAIRAVEAQRALIPGGAYRAAAFERQAQVYHALVETLLDDGSGFDEIFAAVEAGRARAFWDRAGGVEPAPADAGTRMRLGALTRRLEEAELAHRRGTGSPERVIALRRAVLALERRLAEAVRRRGAATPSPRRAALETPAETVAGSLRSAAALVEYVVLNQRILALVLRPEGGTVTVVPASTSEIGRLVSRVRHQLESMALGGARPFGDPGFLRLAALATLRELYDALIAPLEAALDGTNELVIVPHRVLHHVPFECLFDGSSFIDRQWVVSRAPAASLLVGRRRRRSRGPVFVSGTVSGGPPCVANEVRQVARRLAPLKPDVRVDVPTAEWLSRAREASLVHLSAHGVFRGDNPLFSRISMGDGALFVADVLFTRMRAELVVLSACNSGQVFGGRGEGLSGVTHAFLAAGARGLVASHWRVHDEATAELMCLFYDEYLSRAHGSTAGALSAARARLRDRWPHPFYWGAFGAHGA
jgi:tetratricopeptide (TPR) repeat protein